MKTKHTAGPWIVSQAGDRAIEIAPQDTGSLRICTITQGHREKANARLIARAPELLAHLKFIVDAIADGAGGLIPRDGATVTAARQVIAAAEGAAQ